jgi:hypothetical protein
LRILNAAAAAEFEFTIGGSAAAQLGQLALHLHARFRPPGVLPSWAQEIFLIGNLLSEYFWDPSNSSCPEELLRHSNREEGAAPVESLRERSGPANHAAGNGHLSGTTEASDSKGKI